MAQGPQVYENMVALIGVERANRQFSSVQFSLNGCVFSAVWYSAMPSETPPRSRDVVTWLSLGVSPAAFRLRLGLTLNRDA